MFIKSNIKSKAILCLVSIVCLCLLIFSCKKDPPAIPLADFPVDVAKIFAYQCATSGCHNNASYQAAANLNLSSFANLFKGSNTGSPVIPFSSEFSSLCYFINTYPNLGPVNIPTMPLNGTALTEKEVQTIKNWIDEGAPDINGKIMWADDLKREKYYVVNQGCDVVTVFDAKTQLPMRYIKVGNNPSVIESPHMIRISPDGKYWYIVFVNNNILQKYSTADDRFVGELDLGKLGGSAFNNWNTITISDDSKKAYCVSWQTNSRLAIVDIEKMKLIRNVGGFINGHGSALNKTNDTIYITAQTGNYIYKLDTAANSLSTIVIDASGVINNASSLDPHEITFSPDGSKYFVSCQASNEVRVMQTLGDVFVTAIATGVYPLEIRTSSSKNKLYVTCQNDPSPNPLLLGSVTVIDMASYSASNYKVGFQPHGIALDEKNGFVIVTSRNLQVSGPTPHHTGVCGRNGFVSYFNINTMELLSKKTEVASDPYSAAVRP